MNLTNFDEGQSVEHMKHHFLLPDCHYMIVAPTGSGKTNLLCNMLLKWMKFDNCTIYTINDDQHKYMELAELSKILKNELAITDVIKIDKPENIISVDELDKDSSKIIVFDDIKIDKKYMDMIAEYFSLSRNKNCNCIFLSQSYYDVPKYIRRNTKCFVLFDGLDNTDISHICKDHKKHINLDEFCHLYQQATSEPYSFMVFDKTTNNVPQMYRKRFDHFYVPKIPHL